MLLLLLPVLLLLIVGQQRGRRRLNVRRRRRRRRRRLLVRHLKKEKTFPTPTGACSASRGAQRETEERCLLRSARVLAPLR